MECELPGMPVAEEVSRAVGGLETGRLPVASLLAARLVSSSKLASDGGSTETCSQLLSPEAEAHL